MQPVPRDAKEVPDEQAASRSHRRKGRIRITHFLERSNAARIADEANHETTNLRGPASHPDVSQRLGPGGQPVWDDHGGDVEAGDTWLRQSHLHTGDAVSGH